MCKIGTVEATPFLRNLGTQTWFCAPSAPSPQLKSRSLRLAHNSSGLPNQANAKRLDQANCTGDWFELTVRFIVDQECQR